MRAATLLVVVVLAGCAGTTRRIGCALPDPTVTSDPTAAEELLQGFVATLLIGSIVAGGYLAIGGEAPLR